MTAWMILLIAAAGPAFALLDSIGDDDADAEEVSDAETGDTTLLDDVDAADADPDDPNAPLINEETLTDGTDLFLGTDDARQFIDLAGGDDLAAGGRLSDIIEGGDGSDTISGGGGGDYIYATDANSASASDADADVLDGEGGADFLFFGTGDTATGGSGGDTFVLRQDLDGNATITDFDANADMIVFETDDPETLEVASQTITDEGVIVTLSNGATLTLQGANDTVADEQITFERVRAIA